MSEIPPSLEREQTDESLRIERENADRAHEEDRAAIDDTADAVIRRARERADAVLAAARAKTDGQSANADTGAEAPPLLQRQRVREDQGRCREYRSRGTRVESGRPIESEAPEPSCPSRCRSTWRLSAPGFGACSLRAGYFAEQSDEIVLTDATRSHCSAVFLP